MDSVRLNKYFTEYGILSRRAADKEIAEGRVTVNGVKAIPGMKVNGTETILWNGRPVNAVRPEKVVYALNKPAGVVTTTRSFKGEQNVLQYVPSEVRLYPVGRLDKESSGLILLTNDGDLARKITDAAGHHEKEYLVAVNKDITPNFIERMEKGVFIKELNKQTARCKVKKTGEKTFTITLTQGMNRQIRRMAETLGYEVLLLKRVRIMNILLGDLQEGESRKIEGEELKTLKAALWKPETKNNAKKRNETDKTRK